MSKQASATSVRFPRETRGEIPGGDTLAVLHEEEECALCVRGAGGELLLVARERAEENEDLLERLGAHPLLTRQDYGKVIVAVCYREKMLVPNRLFWRDQLPLLWSFHRDAPGDERLFFSSIREWKAQMVGALPARVEQLYRGLQPTCSFLPGGFPLAKMALRMCAKDREYLFADVREEYVDLLLVCDRSPLLFNTFHHDADDDIFFFMMQAARSCQFDEHARLVLTGNVSPRGQLQERLARYWNAPLLVTEPALNSLAQDASLNTTPFVHLLNLHACES